MIRQVEKQNSSVINASNNAPVTTDTNYYGCGFFCILIPFVIYDTGYTRQGVIQKSLFRP